MLKRLTLGLAIIAAACTGVKKGVNVPTAVISDFMETINEEGLRADLSIIAHDSLSGRDTGSEGLKKAAMYLSKRYEGLGVLPVGDGGTYEQFYDVISPVTQGFSYTVTDKNGNIVDQSTLSKKETANFITVFGGSNLQTGEIVFIGNGIINQEEGINHFPENIEGKWVLVFFEQNITDVATIQQRVNQGGGSGVLLLPVPLDIEVFEDRSRRTQATLGSSNRMSLAYLQDNDQSVPAWNRVHPEIAAKLLNVDGLGALLELHQSIKENPQTFDAIEVGFSLKHEPKIDQRTITTSNIVAFLEGSDPALKEEVVVLSSHYDHVGIGAPDSTGDNIYNGADDDGSGTVAMLSIAQAMVAAKNAGAGPQRSVLFLHVSGEEKGLLGSRYYSDHPIYPIKNTVANINMDMIGRVDKENEETKDYIYVIGGSIISSGLDSLINVANIESVNLDLNPRYNDLNDPNRFYRRSDHWNFGRLGVPFVFFFNGIHADYHRPSDEIEKIEWEVLTKRTQLIFMLTAKVANAEQRPKVDNEEFIRVTQVTQVN